MIEDALEESGLSVRNDDRANGSDAVFNAFLYAVGAIVLLLIGWGVWRVWDVATSPTIALKKTEWACTDLRKKYFRQIGRYGNIHTSVATTCDQYSKVGTQPPPSAPADP